MTSGKYFNKGVKALDAPDIGHVIRETPDKIVVFGHSDYRYDIPKSQIIAVGMNVILNIDFPEIFKYRVDRNAALPTGEPVEKLDEEPYPEYYHGPKEDMTDEKKSRLLYPKGNDFKPICLNMMWHAPKFSE